MPITGYVATYSPGQVIVTLTGTLGSAIVGGFHDEIVTAKREEPVFKKEVGADGEVSRRQSANKSGEVTITTKQNSGSNAILGEMLRQDEMLGQQIFALLIADNVGHELWTGQAWIQGWPEIKRAKDEQPVVWTLDCAELEPHFAPTPSNI